MVKWLNGYIARSSFAILVLFLFLLLGRIVFAETSTPSPSPTPTPTPTQTQDNSSKASELEKQIREYEQKVLELQGQGKTLSSQIGVMNSQIKLTELRIAGVKEKINQLQQDIAVAQEKVSKLETDIDRTTRVLAERIAAVYQVGRIQPWQMFLTARNIDDVFSRLKYLRIVQVFDKKKVYAAEQAKVDYNNQKEIFEDKEAEAEVLNKKLEGYTQQLDSEKSTKESLLSTTKNDERKYQQLLAAARAEYEAILGIVSGKGDEVEVGGVSEGARIASVIQGQSCNSGGSHLHFIVQTNGATQNPFNYLSNADYENCSGSSCNSGDGDPFNPSGSWNWPINPKIKFNQGYGNTWAVNHTWVGQIYNFHNGVDINSDSSEVKAVKSGTLFRGSYSGGGGCALRYVRVKHNEDGIDTLYLHVNY